MFAMRQLKLQRYFIILICVYAAVRIFVYSSAFPLFNPTDEMAHYDLIMKYSNWNIPESETYYEAESWASVINYHTPEYLYRPPFSDERLSKWKKYKESVKKINTESLSPPVYYALAALWNRMGKSLGFKDAFSVYWIRFLNIPIYVALIIISYIFIKRLYPENDYLSFSIPVFLAVIPQSIMYGMNSDVLSPLLLGSAFFCILGIAKSDTGSFKIFFATGLLTAAAFLTKYSNIAILILLLIIALEWSNQEKGRALKTAVLVISAILPISLWIVRNYYVIGDLTATRGKIYLLGWTAKPITEIFDHPLFSIRGILVFWNDLLSSIWRGEFLWNFRYMTSNLDDFYVLSSLLFITCAFVVLIRKQKGVDHTLLLSSMLCFVISVLFLILMSVSFDFGNCFYPSRNYPFITSGRLIFGTIIPFLILYITGLHILLSMTGFDKYFKLIVVLIAFSISLSELMTNWHIFQSQFNLYHYF